MNNADKQWMLDHLKEDTRKRIDRIDRELSALKARYRVVRQSYSKDSKRASDIRAEASRLRKDRQRILDTANTVKEALG